MIKTLTFVSNLLKTKIKIWNINTENMKMKFIKNLLLELQNTINYLMNNLMSA